MKAAGARIFCQTKETALVSEVIEAVIARNPGVQQFSLSELCAAMLENASMDKAAA
jgi:chemotaxis response regulator CheB